MFQPLTKRQKEILDFIRIYTQLNGYAPSLLDIKSHFQLSAISTVHEHLQNLKEKGYIQREINQARSIKLVNPTLSDEDFVEIPILGSFSKNDAYSSNKSTDSIRIHKEMLDAKGKYFGVKIIDDSLLASNMLIGDMLIFKEVSIFQTNLDTKIVMAKLPKGKTIIAKYLKDKNKVHIQSLFDQEKITQDFDINSQLITLIRNY